MSKHLNVFLHDRLAGRLSDVRFTVIHPHGIRRVLSQAEINEILRLTEQLVA